MKTAKQRQEELSTAEQRQRWAETRWHEILRPREGAVLFEMGGGWGNSIVPDADFGVLPFSKVHGFKHPMPKVGDVLVSPMQSGRVTAFIFTDVRPCGDPPDMFFADVQYYGVPAEGPLKMPERRHRNDPWPALHVTESKRFARPERIR